MQEGNSKQLLQGMVPCGVDRNFTGHSSGEHLVGCACIWIPLCCTQECPGGDGSVGGGNILCG